MQCQAFLLNISQKNHQSGYTNLGKTKSGIYYIFFSTESAVVFLFQERKNGMMA